MDKSNRIINGLWIGKELNPLAVLCIKSFIANGHEFHLWIYDKIKNIPKGTIIEDAREIIPKNKVFFYSKGIHKGSVAGFSDIFRAKLLYDKGGWYTDMDVTCLKPLNFREKYVFRNHCEFLSVGNLIKCPKGNNMMLNNYQETKKLIDHNNEDWEKPIKILNKNIINFKLINYIKKDICNSDSFKKIKKLLKQNNIPKKYYVIHWCNEFFNMYGINQYNIKKYPLLNKLYNKYDININLSFLRKIKNFIRLSLRKHEPTKYPHFIKRIFKKIIKIFLNLLSQSNIFIYLNTKHIYGPKKINYKEDELVVISVIKNAELYIKQFIEHYFSLGVKHIFLLDNNSKDNTILIAKRYKNITIFKSKLPYRFFEYGLSVYLVKKFCKNRWCLFVDIDEIFDYPYSNILNLSSFLEYLNKKSYNAVILQMLDMFSDKEFSNFNKEENNIKKTYKYYDINNIKKTNLDLYYNNLKNNYLNRKLINNISNNKIKFYSEGIRNTIFNCYPWLTKHTLFKLNNKIKPFLRKHLINNADIADLSCVLYHYRFLNNFKEMVSNYIKNKEYSNNLSEIMKYHEILKIYPNLCLKQKTSKKLKSTNDLIKNKFLIVSKEYLDWVAKFINK